MLASNSSANGFPDRMNGLDFFFSPPATTTDTGNNGEDDDWGDFVESSDATRVDSNGFFADRNGANSLEDTKPGSAPSLMESEKKSQAQWVASRGPMPLSVFGEEEEDADGDGSSAPDSTFRFPLDSFSIKHNNGTGSVNKVVNTNTTVGISDLIANLYRGNGQDELKIGMKFPENNPGHPEMNGKNSRVSSSRLDVNLSSSAGVCVNSHLGMDAKESLSSHTIESSGVSLENLNGNPLKLETERSEGTHNVVNSSSIGITLGPDYSNFRFADKHDDINEDDDGWEFKTAESMFQSGDGVSKEEQDNTKSGSAVVRNTANLSSGVWGPSTNGTGPNFDSGKIDAVTSVFDRENGDDDSWANGWEFKAAEAPKNHLTNKESNGWGFGPGFEPTSAIEITTPHQSNSKKELQTRENGSISFPNNANVNSEETSWGFEQLSLKNGKEKGEKEVQTDKPKGALALSLFGDEEVENSDTMALEDNPISVCDFSLREKTKAPTPPVSINDLISGLYSQVEEKSAVKYGFASVRAATDSNLVNGEDDSWEFQGPAKSVVDLGMAEGADDFDGTSWELQGAPVALINPHVVEGVNEFDDDSWEFQGSSQPVNGSNLTNGVEENDAENLFSFSDEFRECHEKPVVQLNDYQNLFEKLKTELSIIARNHLEMLKKACNLDADSDELAEVQKFDSELEDLQNWLTNDVLIGEVNLESLHPKSSGITELIKDLQEPKFRAIDSEGFLSERLLLAEKDWKSAIELLKHAMLTLKTLNVCSPEQQSKYVSTWFAIASACAQELRHAASIWKQVIEKDVQEEILSKPQGKSFTLSVGEVYRVTKILKTSARLYKPWIILAPTYNIMAVLDECAKLWLSSGLEEALQNNFDSQGIEQDYSADQLLQSIKYIDEVDAFTQHNRTISTTASTCYISGLNAEIVPGIKTVEWNGEHYLLPLANLWANLISRDPPSLPHQLFSTVS